MVWFGGHPFLEQRTAGRSLHETSNSDQPPFWWDQRRLLGRLLGNNTSVARASFLSTTRCARTGDTKLGLGSRWVLMMDDATSSNKMKQVPKKEIPDPKCQRPACGERTAAIGCFPPSIGCHQVSSKEELPHPPGRAAYSRSQAPHLLLCNPGPPKKLMFHVCHWKSRETTLPRNLCCRQYDLIHPQCANIYIIHHYTILYYSNLSLLAFWGLVLYPDFPNRGWAELPREKNVGSLRKIPKTTSGHLLDPFWVYPIMRYTKIC